MVYQEKDKKLADNKSTAYTFLLIGGGGLILVLLFALDVIPFPAAADTRIMMGIVMTALFIIFLGIGAAHFRKIRQMTADADMEVSRTEEIRTWFLETYPAEDAAEPVLTDSPEATADTDDVNSTEQLYFKRYEQMQAHLHIRYDDLAEDYEEYLLEEFYNIIYP